MDADLLAARPGVLHEDVGRDVAHLAHDVQLAQAVEAGAPFGDRLELVAVLLEDLADRMQPVVDQAAALAVDRGGDAAAAVVAHHHDVLHLETSTANCSTER